MIMRKYYRVQANINLDAIYHNVEQAKKLLKPETKLMAVIKADGYGHGAVEIAETIDSLADAYGVAILEEGIELRKAGITKPILILGFTPQPQYGAMIDYDIMTAVFQADMAEKISQAAVSRGKTAGIHLKLDTGMSRIGFALDDAALSDIIKIAGLPGIRIEGCFSHFARMDEADKAKAMEQFSRYCEHGEGWNQHPSKAYCKQRRHYGGPGDTSGYGEGWHLPLWAVSVRGGAEGEAAADPCNGVKGMDFLRKGARCRSGSRIRRHVYNIPQDKGCDDPGRLCRRLSALPFQYGACPDPRAECAHYRPCLHGSVYGGCDRN